MPIAEMPVCSYDPRLGSGSAYLPILRACATVRLFHFVHDGKAAVSLGRVELVAPHQPRGPRCSSNSSSATLVSGLFSPHDPSSTSSCGRGAVSQLELSERSRHGLADRLWHAGLPAGAARTPQPSGSTRDHGCRHDPGPVRRLEPALPRRALLQRRGGRLRRRNALAFRVYLGARGGTPVACGLVNAVELSDAPSAPAQDEPECVLVDTRRPAPRWASRRHPASPSPRRAPHCSRSRASAVARALRGAARLQ